MNIDELIGRLLAMRDEFGDMKVEARNKAGDFDDVRAVTATHYGRPHDIHRIILIET